jgi:hypothetical protein
MNDMKKIRRQRLTDFDSGCECLELRALNLRYCLYKLLDGGILALRKDA